MKACTPSGIHTNTDWADDRIVVCIGEQAGGSKMQGHNDAPHNLPHRARNSSWLCKTDSKHFCTETSRGLRLDMPLNSFSHITSALSLNVPKPSSRLCLSSLLEPKSEGKRQPMSPRTEEARNSVQRPSPQSVQRPPDYWLQKPYSTPANRPCRLFTSPQRHARTRRMDHVVGNERAE